MKNRKVLFSFIIPALFMLCLPFNKAVYEDGGTKTYTALSYKMIFWNEIKEGKPNAKSGFELVLFPNNFKSIDEI